MSEKHNGWTNYATWRIDLEIIDDIEFETKVCAATIQEIVEDVVFSQFDLGGGSRLVYEYARAFVSEVNFYEIAESVNERLDEQD